MSRLKRLFRSKSNGDEEVICDETDEPVPAKLTVETLKQNELEHAAVYRDRVLEYNTNSATPQLNGDEHNDLIGWNIPDSSALEEGTGSTFLCFSSNVSNEGHKRLFSRKRRAEDTDALEDFEHQRSRTSSHRAFFRRVFRKNTAGEAQP